MENKFIISLLIFVILLTSGCKECKVNSDCDSKVRESYSSYSEKCLDVECNVNNKCEIDIINNCCGNKRCEENVGENKCTCETDCGKCEGKGKVKIGSREYDAKYIKYYCNETDDCVFGVEKSLIRNIDLTDSRDLRYFKMGMTSSLDQPFNIDSSKFEVKIKIEDTDEDLVFPVTITSLKLTEGEFLIGEKIFNKELKYVGDYFIGEIPISADSMQEIEEEKRMTLVIDYVYIINERVGRNDEGDPIYEKKTVRDSYEKRYSSKLFFVNPGES